MCLSRADKITSIRLFGRHFEFLIVLIRYLDGASRNVVVNQISQKYVEISESYSNIIIYDTIRLNRLNDLLHTGPKLLYRLFLLNGGSIQLRSHRV